MKVNTREAERRAKLLKQYRDRKQRTGREFGQNQNQNQNQTRGQAKRPNQKTQNPAAPSKNQKQKSDLAVSVRRGEVVHHQRMLSQDVNVQATQHITQGIPVNKSRYNGFDGEQLTTAKLKTLKTSPDSVKIINFGGLGEMGIGNNMSIIEYKDEIVIVDMGMLFADGDYPGINYMIPDTKYLEDNIHKVKAVMFTHAHLDHIGAVQHLLPKFNTLTPIYATEFTLGMVKKRMAELDNPPDMNYIAVDPSKHEKIQLSEHISVEFIHMLHSIPGNCALFFRTPVGNIAMSGDWRFEDKPLGPPADWDHYVSLAETEGIDLLINESTNIDSPGKHPHSEYDVADNFGKIMDNYASGRIIISSFASQIGRIGTALQEAAKRGRKVAFAGFSMVNNVEVAVRARVMNIPKDTIMKIEDIIKLPDEKITIICTGSQGETNAVLARMISGAHKYIKVKASDTIVFSSRPIPGNEPHVVTTVDGLLREGAKVIQDGKNHIHNLGPLHLSGHAYYEDHVKYVTALKPKNYVPYHGEFYMLEHNAEMAENVAGIPRKNIIVADDGDIIELTKDKTIRRAGRIPVGSKLFDNADKPVHEAVVKDRIHISQEGIFIIILTLSKKTGHLIKTPDIVSRAFIYLDNSEELVGKIRHYLRTKTDKSTHTDLKTLKEEIREDITHILFDATGHTPVVIPVINKV